MICGHPGLHALNNRFWLGPMGGMWPALEDVDLVAGASLGALSNVYTRAGLVHKLCCAVSCEHAWPAGGEGHATAALPCGPSG